MIERREAPAETHASMTIAAASFFAATPAGATGQIAPGQPLPTADFADAMAGALAMPSTAAAAPVAASPGVAVATPTTCALVDMTALAVPFADADATALAPAATTPSVDDPIATPAGPIAPSATLADAQATPRATGDAATPTAQTSDRPLALIATPEQPPAPPTAPRLADDAPTAATAAAPTEADREPAVETEPADVDQPIPSTAAPTPPVIAASPALTLPSGVLRPVAEEAADEPAGTDPTQPAVASGKSAEIDGHPAPATAAPSQPATFAERLPAAANDLAAPPPASGAVAGPSAQPAAVRTADLPAPTPPPRAEPVLDARPGHLGREMGVEIARRLSAGGEELTVRLNPVEMGRIEVRLSFDERGSLRALVSAESAAALEMLRRDHLDLGRALADAGVRADASSFRFDGRSGGGEGGQYPQRREGAGRAGRDARPHDDADPAPLYRPLRASGRVDLIA